ncbi:hypothetical protein [Vagococcus sp.]|uniref:hypothetical protein n=1 Tax=Vagococcus sp. TaxID=1933889 RepID=UPI0010EC554B|nr:hypothetical protein [Listeria monocytogenes]
MNNYIWYGALLSTFFIGGGIVQNNVTVKEYQLEIKNSAILEYGTDEKLESNVSIVSLPLSSFYSGKDNLFNFPNRQNYLDGKHIRLTAKNSLPDKFSKIEEIIVDLEESLEPVTDYSNNSALGEVLSCISGKLIYGTKQN